jgi:hypothetical protein
MSFLPSMIGTAGSRALALVALVAALGLSACTTIEGTNAMTDPATFEREVMRTTLAGVGVIDSQQKEFVPVERGPLVVPASGSTPPAPQPAAQVAAIPEDSSRVQLDASGLTTADLERLRGGRVIDANSVAGRPLTDGETRQLAARMQAYRAAQGMQQRSIYMPPEQYFQRVGGQDLICLAANGNLVPVTDPSCPPEVRAQLANRN